MVGGGVMGLSAAWRLSQRGHQVTLFEQHPLGHDRGSSHGASRIVRKAYPDAFYTEHMLRAYPMWAELDALAGGGILHEVGLLYFGFSESQQMVSMHEGLRDLRVPHKVVDSGSVSDVMPGLRLRPDEFGVFTPEAGWVDAAKALSALWKLARSGGAKLRQECIGAGQVHEDAASGATAIEDLERGFDAVVLCPGAWISKFVDLPVKVTMQTFGYLEHRLAGPVWIEDSDDNLYGFPTEPGGSGVKVGVHYHGPEIDPDDPVRQTNPRALDKIRALAARRFGVNAARMSGDKACLYTNTANDDFLLGRLGERTYYASACSGHGFKFGPYIGKLLADFVEGKDAPENHPRLLGNP